MRSRVAHSRNLAGTGPHRRTEWDLGPLSRSGM
jgi:hypothetical protein